MKNKKGLVLANASGSDTDTAARTAYTDADVDELESWLSRLDRVQGALPLKVNSPTLPSTSRGIDRLLALDDLREDVEDSAQFAYKRHSFSGLVSRSSPASDISPANRAHNRLSGFAGSRTSPKASPLPSGANSPRPASALDSHQSSTTKAQFQHLNLVGQLTQLRRSRSKSISNAQSHQSTQLSESHGSSKRPRHSVDPASSQIDQAGDTDAAADPLTGRDSGIAAEEPHYSVSSLPPISESKSKIPIRRRTLRRARSSTTTSISASSPSASQSVEHLPATVKESRVPTRKLALQARDEDFSARKHHRHFPVDNRRSLPLQIRVQLPSTVEQGAADEECDTSDCETIPDIGVNRLARGSADSIGVFHQTTKDSDMREGTSVIPINSTGSLRSHRTTSSVHTGSSGRTQASEDRMQPRSPFVEEGRAATRQLRLLANEGEDASPSTIVQSTSLRDLIAGRHSRDSLSTHSLRSDGEGSAPSASGHIHATATSESFQVGTPAPHDDARQSIESRGSSFTSSRRKVLSKEGRRSPSMSKEDSSRSTLSARMASALLPKRSADSAGSRSIGSDNLSATASRLQARDDYTRRPRLLSSRSATSSLSVYSRESDNVDDDEVDDEEWHKIKPRPPPSSDSHHSLRAMRTGLHQTISPLSVSGARRRSECPGLERYSPSLAQTPSLSPRKGSLPVSMLASTPRPSHGDTRMTQYVQIWTRSAESEIESTKQGMLSRVLQGTATTARKRLGRRESLQIFTSTDPVDEYSRESEDVKGKGRDITQGSRRRGIWTPAEISLDHNGKISIMSETHIICSAKALRRTDIRQCDPSLFSRAFCVAINVAEHTEVPTEPVTPRSPSISFLLSHVEQRRQGQRTLYIAFSDQTVMQTWLATLHSLARTQWHKRKPTYFDRIAATQSDVVSQDAEVAVGGVPVRIWRGVALQINELRSHSWPISSDAASGTLSAGGIPPRVVHRQQSNQHEGQGSGRIGRRDYSNASSSICAFCEITIDDVLVACSRPQDMASNTTWHERFRFDDLRALQQPLTVKVVKIDKGNRQPIGQVDLSLATLRRDASVEAWFPVIPSTTAQTVADERYELALGVRIYEIVILPYSEYIELHQSLDPSECVTSYDLLTQYVIDLDDFAARLLRVATATDQAADLLTSLAYHELDVCAPNAGTLFRGNTLFTKATEVYMRMSGMSFLQESLGQVIDRIYRDKVELEIDPAKAHPDAVKSRMAQHIASLQYWVTEMWSAIYKARSSCPAELRSVFRAVHAYVAEKFSGMPDADKSRVTCISALVFLRFFVPAILNPRLFNLSLDHLPNTNVQRTLTLIAKTIQGLANMTLFGSKEPWMSSMNGFVQSNQSGFEDYIASLCTASAHQAPDRTSPSYPPYVLARYIGESGMLQADFEAPTLPFVIDLPRELAQLATLIAGASRHRGRTPNEESENVRKLRSMCQDISRKSRTAIADLQQSGQLVLGPTSHDRVLQPRLDFRSSRSRGMTTSHSHSGYRDTGRLSKEPIESSPDETAIIVTMANLQTPDSASRSKRRSYTVSTVQFPSGSTPATDADLHIRLMPANASPGWSDRVERPPMLSTQSDSQVVTQRA